jgi:hypothetical protein
MLTKDETNKIRSEISALRKKQMELVRKLKDMNFKKGKTMEDNVKKAIEDYKTAKPDDILHSVGLAIIIAVGMLADASKGIEQKLDDIYQVVEMEARQQR